MEEDSASRGFKVEDRRRFHASGDAKDDSAQPESPVETRREARDEPPPPAEMTFSTFVIGLSTQALVLLGEIADPTSSTSVADLAGAKQMIDILGMLHAKTRGNLDEAEAGLIENVLYDLRMKYVQRSRSK